MRKKILIVCIIAIVAGTFFVINSKNNNNNNNNKTISVSEEKVPVKIKEIDYKIEKIKNKKGKILIYLKAKNNGSITINQLSADVSDGNKLDTTIEYLQKIKPNEKTDNYDSIDRSKDDRTKIPVKGKDGNYINELGVIKVNSISYTYDDNGIEKIVEYNTYTNKYTVSNY